MTLICDAGALVALERNDRPMWRRLKLALESRTPPVTHGGVLAQVWRGGYGRQAMLARAIDGIDVAPLDEGLGRTAGALLRDAGSSDAIDAALVALATDDDRIATSDPGDIQHLVTTTGRYIDVIAV